MDSPTFGLGDEELASIRVRGLGDPITGGCRKGFGGGRDMVVVVAETARLGGGGGGIARLGSGRRRLGRAGSSWGVARVVSGSD